MDPEQLQSVPIVQRRLKMSLRVILARLNGTPSDENVLGNAFAMSKVFCGHTVALFSRPEPRTDSVIVDEGFSAADYEDLMKDKEREWKQFAMNAYKTFEKWRAKNEIPFIRNPTFEEGPSAEWQMPSDIASESMNIARFGVVSDIVVSAAPTTGSNDTGLEAALFDTGRPMLLAPEDGNADVIGGTVVIAWNGSVEASHAVVAAMPLLNRAEHVFAFTVPKGALQLNAAKELAAYLSWHGIRASVIRAEAGGANSISGALLDAVKKVKANLLVMGAYTHSRVRERLFGGVTKDVLKNADIPVLMAR
jgi:nucleotide-binding universal stress UspA family protein